MPIATFRQAIHTYMCIQSVPSASAANTKIDKQVLHISANVLGKKIFGVSRQTLLELVCECLENVLRHRCVILL